MPEPSDDPLFKLLTEIGIIAQLSRTLFEARMPDGMGLPHFSVLNHLVRRGDGKTPLALARAFQVPKTTMTHTLSGLEARDLVRIEPNPEDGRSKRVCLTGTGRAFRDGAVAAFGPDIARLGQAMPAEVTAELLPGLERLRIWLDENRP